MARGRKTEQEHVETSDALYQAFQESVNLARATDRLPERKGGRPARPNPFTDLVSQSFANDQSFELPVRAEFVKNTLSMIRIAANRQGIGIDTSEHEVPEDPNYKVLVVKARQKRQRKAKAEENGSDVYEDQPQDQMV